MVEYLVCILRMYLTAGIEKESVWEIYCENDGEEVDQGYGTYLSAQGTV